MNRIDPNQIDPNQIDNARFDLLADGELSEAQRRELLGGLDDEPGGWRCCALALLESQEWKRQIGAIVRQAGPDAAGKRPLGRSRRGPDGKTLAAMAVCFLVALFLGLVIRDLSTGPAPAERRRCKRPLGRSRRGPDGKTLAAMAVCFLVALFLGLTGGSSSCRSTRSTFAT